MRSRPPRRAARYPRFDHGEPIRRPNLALLAGVLMIPAVLSMASYPTPTHALMIDLPMPAPYAPPAVEATVQRISVTPAGEPVINGLVTDRGRLADHLAWLATQDRAVELVFEPAADAPYGASLEVLAALKRSGLTQGPFFCFGGIEKHRRFTKGEGAPRGVLWHPPQPDAFTQSASCTGRPTPIS